MSYQTPGQALLCGVEILNPYLQPLGFRFQLWDSGSSSGGDFAYGYFIKSGGFFGKKRKIELPFRHSLGLVSYNIGSLKLSHEDYLDILGKKGQNKFPTFSDVDFAPFHALLWDLENLLNDFTEKDAVLFKAKAPEKIKELDREQGIAILANKRMFSSDKKYIALAKIEFRKGNYLEVDRLKRELRYPDQMTAAEKKLFELNDDKI